MNKFKLADMVFDREIFIRRGNEDDEVSNLDHRITFEDSRRWFTDGIPSIDGDDTYEGIPLS